MSDVPPCTCTLFPCGLHYLPRLESSKIRELARDYAIGKVWISQDPNEMLMRFPIIVEEAVSMFGIERFRCAAFVFEYMEKALPRGINGKPMFVSLCFFNALDFQEFHDHFERYRKALV